MSSSSSRSESHCSSSSSSTSNQCSISSCDSSEYTSSSGSLATASDQSGKLPYLTTEKILARCASSLGPISIPPNASMLYEPARRFTPYISLGPVIGMVTDTTARVLIEVSADAELKCFATENSGVQHGASLKCTANGPPSVFQFTELKPNTYYKITFDIPVPGLVKAGFKTLPSRWSLSKGAARIAVVSGNKFSSTRDNIPHKTDLWKALYRQIRNGDVDYALHLGNIVYVDSDEYEQTSGEAKVYKGEEGDCLFDSLVNYVSKLEPCQWSKVKKSIANAIRNIYRDTWSHPTTRHCLANCPNLMILNDHEISDRFCSERAITTKQQGARHFVQLCAYDVYNEYCRALFEDLRCDKPVRQAYHFHALGDVGFLFLESRAESAIHKHCGKEEYTDFLGSKQWKDLDYALAPDNGYFSSCKCLFVCSALPIAQAGEHAWLRGGNKRKNELLGSWNTPEATAEASLLLTMLFNWKAASPGRREVVLLAGSDSGGGVTSVTSLQQSNHGDAMTLCDAIKQITSGPVAADTPFKNKPTSLSSAAPGCLCRAQVGLGALHKFKHNKIINKRNVAFVDVTYDRSQGEFRILSQHIVASSKSLSLEIGRM